MSASREGSAFLGIPNARVEGTSRGSAARHCFAPAAAVLALHVSAVSVPASRVYEPPSWRDDFTMLDSSAWRPRLSSQRYLDAWNDPALTFVRDGLLHVLVEARAGEYYTAQIRHRDLVTHGRVTARVRCPETKGWWAALWLQADNTALRGALEVDVWECNRNVGDSILHAVHEYDRAGQVGSVRHLVAVDPAEWHVVSVTLRSNQPIVFEMDGIKTVSPYVWPADPTPVRLLVTGHVGSWGGVPDPTVWPDSALVDWVDYSSE